MSPHPHPYFHAWGRPGHKEYSRAALIVKVETDEGLTGWAIGDQKKRRHDPRRGGAGTDRPGPRMRWGDTPR